MPEFLLTLIAESGERFADFSPYVASVNNAGLVAFQAALTDGGSGVFTGTGGDVEEVAGPAVVGGVTSHPDVNDAGAFSFYGQFLDGREAVFLLRDGRLQAIADTGGPFGAIGPLGPTMNEAGTVAFRADRPGGVSGIFAGDETVADTDGPWSGFHGLPVITGDGAVVFRADRKDGVQGIYEGRAGSVRAVVETGKHFETLALFPSVGERGTVAFAATLGPGESGIFTVGEGPPNPIIGAGRGFESFRGALISASGAVVHLSTPRGGSLGLFAGPDALRDRILAIDDPLEGSTVADFAANPVSVNNRGQIALRVGLANGRQLILRADPEDHPEG